MNIVSLKPHKALLPYVYSYLLIEDVAGHYSGVPLYTCPEPLGVLTVNLGRPSYHESGRECPNVGFSGIQTQARKWISQPETFFVMAFLTIPGIMALFPNIGCQTSNSFVDLSDVWGEPKANKFRHCFPDSWQPDAFKKAMDKWLLEALLGSQNSAAERFRRCYEAMTTINRVDVVSDLTGITQRTMQRQFQRHLGVSPKQILILQNLQSSIKSKLKNELEYERSKFSDQSHEIRTWRKHLDRTPSMYVERSEIGKAFDTVSLSDASQPLFYL